jgi:hypothetical protein
MDEISSGDCTRGLAPKMSVTAAFSTHEFLLLATVLDTDVRLLVFVENLEGEVLEVGLDFLVIIFAADHTLRVKDTNIGEIRRCDKIKRLGTYVLCGFIAT